LLLKLLTIIIGSFKIISSRKCLVWSHSVILSKNKSTKRRSFWRINKTLLKMVLASGLLTMIHRPQKKLQTKMSGVKNRRS